MREGYCGTAWMDVRSSPQWLMKIATLALISLIPLFGNIVLYGYLLGWSRDLAWGIHSSLPSKVFQNNDGKLYVRGVFFIVIILLFSLIPLLLFLVLTPLLLYVAGSSQSSGEISVAAYLLLDFFPLVLVSGITVLFIWVGAMRMSIYGRLAPGLQVRKIAAMICHDLGGLLRIMTNAVVLGLVYFLVVVIVLCMLIGMLLVYVEFADMFGALSLEVLNHGGIALLWFFISIIAAVLMFLTTFMLVFMKAIVIRALGYWMLQFQVFYWGGQDDLMPFQNNGNIKQVQSD